MRDNPDYALTDADEIADLVRENPWCTFVTSVPGRGLVASHYPVVLDEASEGIVLLSHMGRPDERTHALGRHEMLAIVSGPSGYVSPGWYGTSPAVPTWNFVVAHLHGTPEPLSDRENLDVLDRLVTRFESPLPEPFLMTGTLENAEYASRIVHGTVGFRMRVERFEAKRKLNQDKSADVVERVIAALRRPGPYRNPRLAEEMARHHGIAPRTEEQNR